MASGFDEALRWVRGLRLYETRVRVRRGATVVEGTVNEVAVIKNRASFRIDCCAEWFSPQKHGDTCEILGAGS